MGNIIITIIAITIIILLLIIVIHKFTISFGIGVGGSYFGCGQIVSTLNGAAAEVMNFAGLGKRYALACLGNHIQREYPQVSVKNIKVAATPLVLTPFAPFPTAPSP